MGELAGRMYRIAAGATALFVCGSTALAGEAKPDRAWEASVGQTHIGLDTANGVVTARHGAFVATGKGLLVKVSVPPEGAPGTEDLTETARAKKPLSLSDTDCVAASIAVDGALSSRVVFLAPQTAANTVVRVPVPVLGFPAAAALAGYDLVTGEFIGPVIGQLTRYVKAGGAGVVALAEAGDIPVLLCTSGTVSAGPPDVSGVTWDANGKALSGVSVLQKDKPYELRLFAPPGPGRWSANSATVAPPDQEAGVSIDMAQTRHWLRVMLRSPQDRSVTWTVGFVQKPAAPTSTPKVVLTATADSARRVRLTAYTKGADILVRRSDGLEFVFKGTWFDDDSVSPSTAYTYTAHPLSWKGLLPAVAKAEAKTPDLPPLPPLPDVHLSDLDPVKAENGWNGAPRCDLSIEDNPIRIRGETYKRGMGVHAVSELAYTVHPKFTRFVSVIGVDDEKNDSPSGTVTFAVYADTKELYKSDVLTAFHERVCLNLEIPKGAKLLRLLVGDGGNGVGCDHADWANAGFLTDGPIPLEELRPPEPGFARVFNGKDLTGWDGDPRLWSVRNGIIRGETTPENKAEGNTFLVWRGGTLKDFVLKLKFRIQNGNSGVQYRSQEIGKWRISGYQAEVENAPGKVGFLYDEARRGWLANVGEFLLVDKEGTKQVIGHVADKDVLIKQGYYKPKDWNEYIITARGNHIVHVLNGYQTVEVVDNDAKASTREGLLALQIHAGPPMVVEFRDIQIKQLKANYGSASHLFNGKDLSGWVHSSDALKDTWGVKDGVLVNSGKPAGYVRTEADYDNYVLSLQMRHITKGNSGVLVRKVGPDKVWPRSIEAQGQFMSMGDIWNIDKFPMTTDPARTNGRHTRKMHASNENGLNQWNRYEITLDGGDLEIQVNGLVQNTATDCWVTPGKICLQSEGAQIEFRNIVLLPIIRPDRERPVE